MAREQRAAGPSPSGSGRPSRSGRADPAGQSDRPELADLADRAGQAALDLGIAVPPPVPTLAAVAANGGVVDLYAYEAALAACGRGPIAGADEAGRGACAGPLVAAAVILPADFRPTGLNDSKLMTEPARERVYAEIVEHADWAVSVIPAGLVDRLGVQEANYTALRESIAKLAARPGTALIDGFAVRGITSRGRPVLAHAVVKGDRLVACIAAASVVAKVTRDRIMVELDGVYPEYGFASHKGYATSEHQGRLDRVGPCPEHRFSYANVPSARTDPDGIGTMRPAVVQNMKGSARPSQGDLLDAGAAGAG